MKANSAANPLYLYIGLSIALLILPWILPGRYYLFLATMVVIYIIMVLGLNLIVGYTGLLSLAHGAFFAIGAYTCGILQVRGILSYWSALGVGTLSTGLIGALVGLAILRARGPYLAIGTMCLSILTALVLMNWQSLTGGTSLSGIDGPGLVKIGSWQIDFYSGKVYYYFVSIFLLVCIAGVYRLINSRIGHAFMAIRDQEELAEAVGVNTMRFKILSFSIGSLLAGLAGGLYAGFMGSLDPGTASVGMSFNLLVMSIVGGAGTISGAFAGTILLWMLPEVLQASEEFKPLIFGIILLVIIIFMPKGIMGRVKALHPALAKWIQ
jgi:branched-chain amino acid transport system permease protein